MVGCWSGAGLPLLDSGLAVIDQTAVYQKILKIISLHPEAQVYFGYAA